MNTIVKKLNEKAVDLGAEGNAKTVVEALNQIIEATGGTPSTTNKITDAIEKIQFGEGGGSGEISDENCITVQVVNNWASMISLQWSNARAADGYFSSFNVSGANNANYVLKANNGTYCFCGYAKSSAILPKGKIARVSCDNGGTLVQADISNEGSRPLEMLVYAEWDANVESPTITFSLVDKVVES